MRVLAGILVFWGVLIDGVGLFAMPLLGQCAFMSEMIKFTTCSAPVSVEAKIAAYLFGMCGIVRALAGLYPTERGAWLAGMGTMLLEVVVTWALTADPMQGAPAIGVCSVFLGLMAATLPEAGAKGKRS
mmetsp:Transcript_9291/g.27858  ORF Transcript_9291/g.27858 Transcript_9291/m.27858 type:complete len:129 (-) Transcript_9291:27-413(-)